jgi:acyl-CoA synthetase (AMP-forming)/AMP-acid ligase II/alkylation response protein AidB-like acyl-CoA dehydrogenase/acyl carrier protein
VAVYNSFVELLHDRAVGQSERTAVTFLLNGEEPQDTLSYAELDLKARALAVRILREISPGDRVLLLHPPSLEFVVSFFACLYAGAVAVATYPPRNARHLQRITTIFRDAQPHLILTSEEVVPAVKVWLNEQAAPTTVICSDGIGTTEAEHWRMPALRSDTLALLQYTSGSTRQPRGVMITHGNIMANEDMIRRTFGQHDQSSVVSWLPIYHDMGLMGNLLQPLYLGTSTVLMSPASFLQKPVRWLSAVSRFQARTTGAPNFAFDLCLRTITEEQKAALDLSRLELLYSGSEPIEAAVLDRFVADFRACGLNRKVLFACYGLAEATVLVTGGGLGTGPRYLAVDSERLAAGYGEPAGASTQRSTTLVSCGRSSSEQDLRVVDPLTSTVLDEGVVGEIWVRGPHVAIGYWGKDAETQELCRAILTNGEGPFLRTGDLGFFHSGELYVTGRIKDLIIIRGLNHYPQDIERTVEACHPALQRGACSAFGLVENGGERVGIAVEVRRSALKFLDAPTVIQAVRRAVIEGHEIPVHGVVLLKPGTLPKTSSGKLNRGAAKQMFLNDTPDAVSIWRESEVPASDELGSRTRADTIINWVRTYGETRVNSFLMDQRRSIPPYIVLDFGNRGLLGLQAPVSVGGSGLTNRDSLRVLAQLAAIDTNLSSFVGVHNALGLRPLLRYGTSKMRGEIVPKLASGRDLGSFAFTEPGAGSNPRAIKATATPDGTGGWLLHGTKKWIGTAAWANYLVVFVQLFDDEGANRGITAFLLEQSMPGLRQGAEELTMGMRGMVQNTVHLEGIRVSPDNIVGEIGEGMVVAQDIMKFGRLCICAAGTGAMKRCVQLMLRYATHRAISTGRLLDNLISRERLTALTHRIAALDDLVHKFSGWLDEGLEVPEEFYALAKVAGPESLALAVDHLIQMLGGRGYIETNIAPQLYRDARLLRIFEGPTETMLMFLGSRLANESKAVDEFLRTQLRAPTAASQLAEAAKSLKVRYLSTGDGVHSSAGFQHVCERLGDFGIWTLWLAIAESGQGPNTAISWLRREQARSSARLNATAEESPDPLSAEELLAVADAYQADIGDVEQQCAGPEYALDTTLRRTSPELVSSKRTLSPAADKPTLLLDPRVVSTASPNSCSPEVAPTEIEEWLCAWIAQRLKVPTAEIDPLRPFADFGVDSVTAAELTGALEEWLKKPVPSTAAWDFPNIRQLATGVLQQPAGG